jgi:hypothetical protein
MGKEESRNPTKVLMKKKKDKVIKIRLKVLFTKSRPHKNKKKYDRKKYKIDEDCRNTIQI